MKKRVLKSLWESPFTFGTVVFLLVFAIVILTQVFFLILMDFNTVKFTSDSDVDVIIDESVATKLSQAWDENDNEFIYCLYGRVNNQTIYIENAKTTKIYNSTPSSVVYQNCMSGTIFNNRLIGTIHPHFNRICSLSSKDIYTYGAAQTPVTAVMCGREKFAFYTPEHLDIYNSVSYEIKNITE